MIVVLWSGCSEDGELTNDSQIKTTFQLESNLALGGSINVHQAFLKLEHIAVSGTRRGKNISGAPHSVPPEESPYRLAESDSAHVSFTVPSRAYDVMDLHLSLFSNQYELVFSGNPVDQVPDPVDNSGGQDNDGGAPAPNNGNPDDEEDNDDGSEDSGRDDGGGDDNSDDGDDGDGDDDDEENDEGDDDSNERDRDDEDDDDGQKDNDNEKKSEEDKKKKSKDKDNGSKGKGSRRSQNADSHSVDLDHFFQNAKPGVAIFGTWHHNGGQINIVFVVTEPEMITVRATQNNGHEIKLEEENSSIVSFDPEIWFEGITVNDLQSASMLTYQGQPVIFIHKDFNAGLFEKLYSRFIQSAQFRFDDPIAE